MILNIAKINMDNSEVTWSSVEMYHRGSKTIWHIDKNGIPRYNFID
jgi:hypothetical protein